ncbi:MAG: hypothetical protein ACWGMZ_05385, partial [Thermoguttaceae bacterium]
NLLDRWSARVQRIISRSGISVRHFRNDDFANEIVRCREIYNATMNNNWGFVKLTDAEFRHLAERLRKIAQEEQVLLAEIDGKPVGFSVTVPDINEAIRTVA